MLPSERTTVLTTLVNFNRPIREIAARLEQFPMDCEQEDATELRANHIEAVLRRYLEGRLDSTDIQEWAQVMEGRSDIRFDSRNPKAVWRLMFRLSNQDVSEKIAPSSVVTWLKELESAMYPAEPVRRTPR